MVRLAASLVLLFALTGCDSGREDAKWLDLEIEIPEEEDPIAFHDLLYENATAELDENGMLTRTYLVPPSWVSLAPGNAGLGVEAPDPFGPPPKPSEVLNLARYPSIYRFHPERITAKEVLEAYGVSFGPGAKARYDPATSTVRVTNSPNQMDLVEAVIGGVRHSGVEHSLSVNFSFFDLPEARALALERRAANQSEHDREYETVLEEVRQGTARIVTTARILARSGQRSRFADSEAIRVFRGYAGDEKNEDEGKLEEPQPAFAIENIGTEVEVDPVLGPDNLTIDMNIRVRHHLAPMEWSEVDSRRPVFSVGAVTRSVTILDGQVLLLGSWSVPAVNGETGERTRRLVFVTPTVVRSRLFDK